MPQLFVHKLVHGPMFLLEQEHLLDDRFDRSGCKDQLPGRVTHGDCLTESTHGCHRLTTCTGRQTSHHLAHCCHFAQTLEDRRLGAFEHQRENRTVWLGEFLESVCDFRSLLFRDHLQTRGRRLRILPPHLLQGCCEGGIALIEGCHDCFFQRFEVDGWLLQGLLDHSEDRRRDFLHKRRLGRRNPCLLGSVGGGGGEFHQQRGELKGQQGHHCCPLDPILQLVQSRDFRQKRLGAFGTLHCLWLTHKGCQHLGEEHFCTGRGGLFLVFFLLRRYCDGRGLSSKLRGGRQIEGAGLGFVVSLCCGISELKKQL
mmetsp:Transcript_8422/g.16363  ORF Transcript_8422/g.16363 Transcript_8422/m.16363 type:complete len:313 (+) Transcript_8422:585-1523(+)